MSSRTVAATGAALLTSAGLATTLALATGLAVAQSPAPAPKSGPSQPTASQAPAQPSRVPGAGRAKPAEALQIAPHRAIYDIVLDQSRSAASVTDMTGRMVYELTGSACEGWTQSMRFVSRMTNQEGTVSLTDMRSSSWEDGQAKAFRFNSSQYREAKLSESASGDATREAPDKEGKVEITKPDKKSITLPPNVHYPIQHSIALLAAAQRGETVFVADLYDGSEKGEKVYSTTTYIAPERPAGHNKSLPPVPSAAPLDDLRSWPVSISYFEAGADKKDAVPSYELAFLYFENGVSRRLFIDYGDFAIRGNLKEITFLEPGKCEKKP